MGYLNVRNMSDNLDIVNRDFREDILIMLERLSHNEVIHVVEKMTTEEEGNIVITLFGETRPGRYTTLTYKSVLEAFGCRLVSLKEIKDDSGKHYTSCNHFTVFENDTTDSMNSLLEGSVDYVVLEFVLEPILGKVGWGVNMGKIQKRLPELKGFQREHIRAFLECLRLGISVPRNNTEALKLGLPKL